MDPPAKRSRINTSESGLQAHTLAISKQDGRPHSAEPGVTFNVQKKKWKVFVQDVLERGPNGKPKKVYGGSFLLEADAIAAKRALEAKIDANFWTTVEAWARDDPLTKDLPLGPVNPADSVRRTVYWRPNAKNGHRPHRVVVTTAGEVGAKWTPACDKCPSIADSMLRKKKNLCFCAAHMSEDDRASVVSYKQTRTDVTVNENAGARMDVCSRCAIVRLGPKRHESKGGCGLCAGCEEIVKQEASANGSSAPPPASKRWEDVVLDKLIPLVGEPIEMRDEPKAMLGELRKRGGIGTRRHRKSRADEPGCDTSHQRRPDLLYALRHPKTARIVACVSVEVDEHSHIDRETRCEKSKVDDTREAIHAWGQREGFTDDRAGHARPDIAAPFYYVFKLNPNACDCSPVVRLDDRIALVAERVKAVFALNRDELLQRALQSESMVPIVECFFHHSAKAAHHLAAFAEQGASGNWDYRGNVTCCPA